MGIIGPETSDSTYILLVMTVNYHHFYYMPMSSYVLFKVHFCTPNLREFTSEDAPSPDDVSAAALLSRGFGHLRCSEYAGNLLRVIEF